MLGNLLGRSSGLREIFITGHRNKRDRSPLRWINESENKLEQVAKQTLNFENLNSVDKGREVVISLIQTVFVYVSVFSSLLLALSLSLSLYFLLSAFSLSLSIFTSFFLSPSLFLYLSLAKNLYMLMILFDFCRSRIIPVGSIPMKYHRKFMN